MNLKDYIRSIPDYPKKGILFRDITTLIKDENAFAETINGAKFKEPKAPKKKAMTMTEARKAVLDTFGCKTAADLKKNKTFSMSMVGEDYGLKTKADWMKLYRRWVAVPESERGLTGSTCINGIDGG